MVCLNLSKSVYKRQHCPEKTTLRRRPRCEDSTNHPIATRIQDPPGRQVGHPATGRRVGFLARAGGSLAPSVVIGGLDPESFRAVSVGVRPLAMCSPTVAEWSRHRGPARIARKRSQKTGKTPVFRRRIHAGDLALSRPRKPVVFAHIPPRPVSLTAARARCRGQESRPAELPPSDGRHASSGRMPWHASRDSPAPDSRFPTAVMRPLASSRSPPCGPAEVSDSGEMRRRQDFPPFCVLSNQDIAAGTHRAYQGHILAPLVYCNTLILLLIWIGRSCRLMGRVFVACMLLNSWPK